MTKHLETVADVIAFLDGEWPVRKLTKRTKGTPSLVRMWINRDRLPPKTFRPITAALQARGATAPDKLWGF